MRAKQNGGLLLREKQARQLSKPLSAAVTDDHRTMEPSNQKSQMDQEYGLYVLYMYFLTYGHFTEIIIYTCTQRSKLKP